MLTTTIVVSKELRDRLALIGNKTESYNDIIEKLYNEYIIKERKE